MVVCLLILKRGNGVNYSWPRIGVTDYERKDWDALEDTNTLLRNGETYSQWIGYRGGIDMFYDLNAFQVPINNTIPKISIV